MSEARRGLCPLARARHPNTTPPHPRRLPEGPLVQALGALRSLMSRDGSRSFGFEPSRKRTQRAPEYDASTGMRCAVAEAIQWRSSQKQLIRKITFPYQSSRGYQYRLFSLPRTHHCYTFITLKAFYHARTTGKNSFFDRCRRSPRVCQLHPKSSAQSSDCATVGQGRPAGR